MQLRKLVFQNLALAPTTWQPGEGGELNEKSFGGVGDLKISERSLCWEENGRNLGIGASSKARSVGVAGCFPLGQAVRRESF